MKTIEILSKLNDFQVKTVAEFVIEEFGKENIQNSLTDEQETVIKQLSEQTTDEKENNEDAKSKIEFLRLFLILLVEQESEFAEMIKEEIDAQEDEFEKERQLASDKRAGVAVDIILVAAAIVPLIQTKIKITKKNGKWEFEFNKRNEKLSDVFDVILKPIEVLAEKIKKLSFGGIEIDGTEKNDE